MFVTRITMKICIIKYLPITLKFCCFSAAGRITGDAYHLGMQHITGNKHRYIYTFPRTYGVRAAHYYGAQTHAQSCHAFVKVGSYKLTDKCDFQGYVICRRF